jgi:enoyl-CoA hydratase/carnithine racemase
VPGEERTESIDLAVEDGVAIVTLDRPERLNAVTILMLDELVSVLDRTDADDAVRAVVFTGRGRAFCAGADLGEGDAAFARGQGEFKMPEDADQGGILARRLFDSAKPLIAAINGPAVGIGATMTLPMDVRLAAEDAKIGFVFNRRGVVPETSASFFLPRLVGISRACEWCFTGRVFGAAEAAEAGLVRSVHGADDLLPAALELAHEMSDHTSRVAVALTRRMLWQMWSDGDPVLAHHLDSEAFHFLADSADVAEGINSFLEKREPSYPMSPSRDLPDFYRRWGKERGGLERADLPQSE